MIFLKNKILIHSHSLLFTRGVCFFFLLGYFRSDRFEGRTEPELRANWEGEGPRGQGRSFFFQ